MNILDILDKKRLNKHLNKREINYFISNYVTGNITDYQASALCMAICINGLDEDETMNFCDAMINSGDKIDLSFTKKINVDKHSSGGVSDTTSLPIVPILACAGLCCLKMSGKGLGFTGGTIDKLSSFDGINLTRTSDEIKDLIKKCGCTIVAQTNTLVPADKKLYALRDTTSTIHSIPLMACSIMSKKIASGSDVIYLDIKCGEGAFLDNYDDAKELARLMRKIGTRYNKKVATMISDMNEPLGSGIGCYLEILDAISVLKGEKSKIYDLVKYSAVNIMELSGKFTKIEAETKFNEIISSGKGYEKFKEMISSLGGDINCIKIIEQLQPTSIVKADKSGYVNAIKAKELGLLVNEMGGGRQKITDEINHSVGIKVLKHIGDKVEKGENIALIYNTNKKIKENLIQEKVCKYFTIKDTLNKTTPLVIEYEHN